MMSREFLAVYDIASWNTLVSRNRCFRLFLLGKHATALPGDVAECGVYLGGSAFLIAAATAPKHIHLFDSFVGLPAPTAKDNHHRAGEFCDTDERLVVQLLGQFANRLSIHKGWMPQTFDGLGDRTFCLVHVDVDLYQSARDCCEFFYPRLCNGGILIFDDYGQHTCRGVKAAVDEFFGDTPCFKSGGQAIFVKNGSPLVLAQRLDLFQEL